MKKILTLILCAMIALSMLALVGCGGGANNYVGTWQLESLTYEGMTVTVTEEESNFIDVTITLADDGTATLTSEGVSEPASWEETDAGVDVYDESTTMSMTLGDDGRLSFEAEGMVFYFAKA